MQRNESRSKKKNAERMDSKLGETKRRRRKKMKKNAEKKTVNKER